MAAPKGLFSKYAVRAGWFSRLGARSGWFYEGGLTAPASVEVRVHFAQLQVPAAGTPAGTTLKAWNGSAWQSGALKRWNGSAWEAATLKRWNGSAWITI